MSRNTCQLKQEICSQEIHSLSTCILKLIISLIGCEDIGIPTAPLSWLIDRIAEQRFYSPLPYKGMIFFILP